MTARSATSHGLEFGPVSIRVDFNDDSVRRDVQSRFALSTRVPSERSWTVSFDRAATGSLGRRPYDMGIRRVGRELLFDSPSLCGHLDLDSRRGFFEVWRRPGFGSSHFTENILRVVTQHIAIEQGALLVHASGIACPSTGVARVFAGPSGAGKTTISEMLRSHGGRVLSDDLVLVSCKSGRASVTATPFRGTINDSPAVIAPTCELAAIHTLEKSETPHIGPSLNPSRSAALLLANTPFGETWDQATRTQALEIAASIAHAVPVTPLAFPKEPGFVHVFGSWLRRGRSTA